MLASASAQTGGADAGSILRQEESLNRPDPDPLPELEEEAPLPELTGIGDVTVEVRSIEFTGDTDLAEAAELAESVEQGIGKALDFEGLQALAERATRKLKDEGWVLARAFLPEQDVSDGEITIQVVAGQLDTQGRAFRIEAIGSRPLRIDPERLGRILTALIPEGDPVRQADLDRAVLLINDLPGIEALARLEAGETPGSTHILLSVREGPLWSGSFNGSNHGSRSTGRERAGFTGNLNDPLGVGDQLTLALTKAEGLELGQLNYRYPLGVSGLMLDLSRTDLRYELVTESAGSDFDGESATNGASLEYPLVRSQQTNIRLGYDWSRDELEDRVNTQAYSDKAVTFQGVTLSADHTDQMFGPAGRTNLSLSPQWGDVELRTLADGAEPADELGTEGSFRKAEYSLSRLQSLGDVPLTLFTELRGQWAEDNLDSSQRFQPGGANGVRAYPGGEASADEGHLFRAELRYQLPGDWVRIGGLRLSVFYDLADVQLHHDLPPGYAIDTAEGRNSYGIEGAGVGLVFTRSDWLSLSLSWAAAIGDNPGRDTNGNNSDGRDDDHRAWLQAVVRL
ncbi:hypothetical protein BB931_01060 [Spiribacter salinus]|nr:hypothetical protein [Spiribacter salinus]